MITLTRKLKKDGTAGQQSESTKRISVRDRLLVKEVQEMEQNLPTTCSTYFPDPNVLCELTLTIKPDEGFWKGGKFKFNINVPEEYNMTVGSSVLIGVLCAGGRWTEMFPYSISKTKSMGHKIYLFIKWKHFESVEKINRPLSERRSQLSSFHLRNRDFGQIIFSTIHFVPWGQPTATNVHLGRIVMKAFIHSISFDSIV